MWLALDQEQLICGELTTLMVSVMGTSTGDSLGVATAVHHKVGLFR